MKLTFLGTGTSTGVPQLGCDCEVCCSADPRDKRLRTSALVETDEGRHILIDCGPDFRQQMLQVGMRPLDAIFITHEHYDHTGGIDDLRPFNVFGSVSIYAAPDCAAHLRERIPYCFVQQKYPGVPSISLLDLRPGEAVSVGATEVLAFRVMHGRLPILGFRIGSLAYITDMTVLPETEWPALAGVRTLVVNALRHAPHNTHQTIDEAVRFAKRVGAERTWLVHMGHSAGLHAAGASYLPAGVAFAYDGLTIEV